MSDRLNTPFTNEHFAAYCLRMVGQPYWYGTCGYKATASLLTRKTNQYITHAASYLLRSYVSNPWAAQLRYAYKSQHR